MCVAMAAHDSIILEEDIDEDYDPTPDEIDEYATWLGMRRPEDDDLLWIASEGLKAPLPEHWKPCKTQDGGEIYYFNFATGESVWDHPCDDYYRKTYEEEKAKKLRRSAEGNGRPAAAPSSPGLGRQPPGGPIGLSALGSAARPALAPIGSTSGPPSPLSPGLASSGLGSSGLASSVLAAGSSSPSPLARSAPGARGRSEPGAPTTGPLTGAAAAEASGTASGVVEPAVAAAAGVAEPAEVVARAREASGLVEMGGRRPRHVRDASWPAARRASGSSRWPPLSRASWSRRRTLPRHFRKRHLPRPAFCGRWEPPVLTATLAASTPPLSCRKPFPSPPWTTGAGRSARRDAPAARGGGPCGGGEDPRSAARGVGATRCRGRRHFRDTSETLPRHSSGTPPLSAPCQPAVIRRGATPQDHPTLFPRPSSPRPSSHAPPPHAPPPHRRRAHALSVRPQAGDQLREQMQAHAEAALAAERVAIAARRRAPSARRHRLVARSVSG